jgi:hypothetical protein
VNADRPWHCMSEGSWFKRWRIRFFGLTSKEKAENMATFAAMNRELIAEMAAEDAEDERRLEAMGFKSD